jgi:hypothetical protein
MTDTSSGKPKSKRGFASMSAERQRHYRERAEERSCREQGFLEAQGSCLQGGAKERVRWPEATLGSPSRKAPFQPARRPWALV